MKNKFARQSTHRKGEKHSLPFGINLISILSFFFSFLLLFFAIVFFMTSSLISNSPDIVVKEVVKQLQSPAYQGVALTEEDIRQRLESTTIIFPILGVITLAMMFLYTISAIFLLKARNWARLLQIILSLFIILLSLAFISSALFIPAALSLIISTVIAGYLLFNQNVKKAFRR